jgi:hypothetical protein
VDLLVDRGHRRIRHVGGATTPAPPNDAAAARPQYAGTAILGGARITTDRPAADARRRPVRRSDAAGHAASLPYELRDALERPTLHACGNLR